MHNRHKQVAGGGVNKGGQEGSIHATSVGAATAGRSGGGG